MSANKIKIVRIIARLNVGGPAIHAILLTKELNDDRFESVLVCGSVEEGEKDMTYLAEEKGVVPVVIPEMGRKINLRKDLAAFFKISRVLKEEKPDIVHTHTAKAGALGRVAAALAGVPVRIHTFHGHIFDGYFNRIQTSLFLFVERLLAAFTTCIIVVSESQKKEICAKYRIAKEEKVKVVTLGLELDRYASICSRTGFLRDRLKTGYDTILVAAVGRLVPIKNHRMLLDACKILKEDGEGTDIRFVIVGDGEERGSLEEYAKTVGVADKVAFIGWQEDMAPVYADIDIAALTSNNEGTPVALIEALASGRPVVATDVGGVSDVVEEGVNGFLVASGDAAALAGKILILAKDGQKRSILGENGRRKVLARYSKERLADDMRKLYESALQEPCKKG